MRRRLTTLLACVSLPLITTFTTTGTLPAASADEGSASNVAVGSVGAEDRGDPDDKVAEIGDTAAREAKVALGAARRVIGGDSRPEDPSPSIALRDLFLRLPALEGAERRTAESVLARPTDGNSDANGDGYDRRSVKRCSAHFCLHWVTSGPDRPRGGSRGDWTTKNLTLLENVWKHHVGTLNYRRPLGDGKRGGDAKLDVYLKNVGPKGYYGYCTTERRPYPRRFLASGYCVLDNDFSREEFNGPPLTSLRVTAAHEFFHSIQYAYDFAEDKWLLEATATWIEEQFVDGANDNRQYLRAGQVRRPRLPLDFYSFGAAAQYGNWAFFEFLSQKFGPGIVRSIWNRVGDFGNAPDQYSIQGVRTAIASRRSAFPGVYAQFAAANTVPAKSYSEGASWPKAPITASYALSGSKRGTGKVSGPLDHLTSRSFDVTRGAKSFKGNWKLLVSVNAPWRVTGPSVAALLHMRNGKIVRRVVPLDRRGDAQVRLPFNGAVRKVTLTMANASTRYRCFQSRSWSCQGAPRDDDRGFTFAAYAAPR